MLTCLHAYMITCLHAYVLACMNVDVTHAYMLASLNAYTLTCMWVQNCTLTCMWVRHAYVPSCIPASMLICLPTCMITYSHAHERSQDSWLHIQVVAYNLISRSTAIPNGSSRISIYALDLSSAGIMRSHPPSSASSSSCGT